MGRLTRDRFGMARTGVVMAVVAFGLVVGGCGGSAAGDSEKAEKKKTESPQKFLDKLGAAVRMGDTAFRVSRLHPAVIQRYGEQQCRDFLSQPDQVDKTRRDKVKRVDKPAPFDFTTDDGAIPIPDARLIIVKETFKGKKGERELHLAPVDGKYRYFIDCGTPLAQP